MGDLELARQFSEQDVLSRDRNALEELKRNSKVGRKSNALLKRLLSSRKILDQRRKQALSFAYPEALPVSQALPRLTESIRQYQVSIICGGTGSGKSTQIPKLLLQMGFGLYGQIAHTQPRRIAARAVAARIATETESKLGEAIGTQVRFDKLVSSASRLKVMTDGILLEEIRNDRWLKNYDAIIIDEVHERSSNIDFALGYIAKILPKRPELKLILMSATVDNESLLSIFDANLVDIQGKQFPITVDYRPINPQEQTEAQAIDSALRELGDTEDVLVFLPGEREITDLQRYLNGRGFDNTEILPLFSRLHSSAQAKVFKPSKFRRVILATNVAETSITIPGIRHVIDSGLARTSRYNPRSKLLELPIAEISQAAAKQRAGRCGREAPGRCIRLYDAENYEQRELFTKPEILRTNLASSILRCESLQLGELASFPLPDKPSPKLISDGVNLLKEISALDRKSEITPLGKQLARLAADPRIARFLLAAADLGQLDSALTIAAALTAGDCRVRPPEQREMADKAHAQFAHRDSDLLFFVNLWRHMEDTFGMLSIRRRRKFCEEKFLSWQRVQQWRDLRVQLNQQCNNLGLKRGGSDLNYKKLHCAFLTAFASLIGAKTRDGDYAGARGITFKIHPRSMLIKRKPQFIVCLEMFETSARYAQIVAKIDAAWVQKAAPHLIKYSYSSPRWDRRTGRAVAVETQRIFGVKLRSDKKVSYVPIDAIQSREIFIRHALVAGEFQRHIDCVRHNKTHVDTLMNLERKLRRSIAPDEEDLYAHYASLVPENVATQKSFERWAGQNPEIARDLNLVIDPELQALHAHAKEAYPDSVTVGQFKFPVRYVFDPVDRADGMTFIVHEDLLPRLGGDAFDKLCPGLLEQKLTLIAKSMPKACRKKISPIAAFVASLLDLVAGEPHDTAKNVGLNNTITRYYQEKTGELLEAAALNNANLPIYLQAHVEITTTHENESVRDSNSPSKRRGKPIRFYHSLIEAKNEEDHPRDDQSLGDEEQLYTRWCFGELKREFHWQVSGNTLVDFQALIDKITGVGIGRYRDGAEADFSHLHGVARLGAMAAGIKTRTRALAGFEHRDILLMCASLGLGADDLAQIRKAAYAHALEGATVPRTADDFDEFLRQSAAEVETLVESMSLRFAELIPRAYGVKKKLSAELGNRWPQPADEMAVHLHELLNGEMLGFSSLDKIASLSRYLTGIERRIDRLQLDPNKDKQKMLLLAEPLALWRKLKEQPGIQKSLACDLRYDIEEIFVNQFAPELSASRRSNLKQVMEKLNLPFKSNRSGT